MRRPFHPNVTPGHFVTIVSVSVSGFVVWVFNVRACVLGARLISRAVHGVADAQVV